MSGRISLATPVSSKMNPAPAVIPLNELEAGRTEPRQSEIWPGTAYPLGATYDGTGTNFALFSEVAEQVELCLFDGDGAETRVDAARGRRLRVARLPAEHRAGPALRLPGARPLRPDQRPALQPDASCCSTRTPRRSTATFDWDQSLFSYTLRRPRQPQRRRLGDAHAASRGDQPVLRLGQRPPAEPRRTPTPSSTRPTSRA